MAKGYAIAPTRLPKNSNNIKPTEINPNQKKVAFNFGSLRTKGAKFNYTLREAKYFKKLIDRLKDVSCWNRIEFQTNPSKSLRCHQINFSDSQVTEKSFGLSSPDIDDDAWQFSISQNEHGRVHGYFVDNTFFIVWLDSEHELYKSNN